MAVDPCNIVPSATGLTLFSRRSRDVNGGDTAHGTGQLAALIDIEIVPIDCETMVVLVDHDIFKSVPADERAGKIVYDTRGIWGAA